MALLALSMGIFIVVTIKTAVFAHTCPFCANLKSECDIGKKPLSMDCGSFEINDKPAEDFVVEPYVITSTLNKLKLYITDDSSLNGGCTTVNYHLVRFGGLVENHNITHNEDLIGEIYTFKSCMAEPIDDDWKACDYFTNRTYFDEKISLVADKCEFNKSWTYRSTVSDIFIVNILFIVLLKLFV